MEIVNVNMGMSSITEFAETAHQTLPSKMANVCAKMIGPGMIANSHAMKFTPLALLDQNGTKANYLVNALIMGSILSIINVSLAKKMKDGMVPNVYARVGSIK